MTKRRLQYFSYYYFARVYYLYSSKQTSLASPLSILWSLLYTGNHTATTGYIYIFLLFHPLLWFLFWSLSWGVFHIMSSVPSRLIWRQLLSPAVNPQRSISNRAAAVTPLKSIFKYSKREQPHSRAQLFLFNLWFYNIHLRNFMPASDACIYVSITPESISLLQEALRDKYCHCRGSFL